MENYNLKSILGPIMIGPSSSHTAGAARLGRIAMKLAPKGFNKVSFTYTALLEKHTWVTALTKHY